MLIPTGAERFTVDDLLALSDLVAGAWRSAAGRDWSVPAGGLDWSCLATADHAVDCVYAPSFFLASRRLDAYPVAGSNLMLGEDATPELLVESLQIATRLLVGLVRDSDPDVRSILFQRPEPLSGAPSDFVPRAGVELILHAHDVCQGLGVAFVPPAELCLRLREHTRNWPMWTLGWDGLDHTDDAWSDLRRGSGR